MRVSGFREEQIKDDRKPHGCGYVASFTSLDRGKKGRNETTNGSEEVGQTNTRKEVQLAATSAVAAIR
jgi:hypothetical protein